ncbi:hypothetical protein OSB04_021267 [Centaurea solstitialis]|uniref:Enoyl reductase (ER) domain-containing protein n=1 Tax=Centaurea solstitialis TaxID=347529 RepID=A0AA38SVI0_9ASTR|nr:hypothetical protein OSB04_021267 [Centaurea solstitialis]
MEQQGKVHPITRDIEGTPQESMFDIKTQTLPPLESDDVIVKCLYISIDPSQISRMKHKSSSHTSAAATSKIMPGMLRENCGYGKDDIVYGLLNWAEYTIVKNGNTLRKLDPMEDFHYLTISEFLVNSISTPIRYSVGTSGLTAYGGFFKVCKPKKGEKVFVSAAAGSVGNLVGQYAKLFGCYVVGCAGTKQKVELLKEKLGFDDAFNYKEKTDLNLTLQSYFPNGIDIYFDNVGGEMLEAVVANMNPFGRVAACGAISQYTNSRKQATPNMIDIIYKRIRIQGFLSLDFYTNDFKDFMQMTIDYVRKGKLCVLEDVSHGIENIPAAFVGLFHGHNVGKKVVQIAQE